MAEMLDISYWQGKVPVDAFRSMTGIDRVILRASRADTALQQDSTYADSIAAARAAGKNIGHYHFNGRIVSVADQAKFFCDHVSYQVGDVLVLDVESTGVVRFNAAETLQFLDYVMSRFPKAEAWVYMSASVTREEDWSTVAAKYKLWVAAYQTTDPTISYWKTYAAWQYTSSGKVPGISGNVDLSRYSIQPPIDNQGGASMGTYSNGLIPRSVMKQFRNTGKYGVPIFIDHLEAAFQECERNGIHPFIGSGQDIFRDMAGQVYWKNYWTARGLPRNAAAPGFSNHGLGVCADISGIGARGSATWNKVQAIFKKYGIVFNVASESWHVQDLTISVANNKVTINSSGSKGDYSGNPSFPSIDAFKAIQQKYKNLGYKITVDGKDGPETQGVVRDFQKKHGLTVDGIHGPATDKVLNEAQPKPAPAKPSTPKAPAYPLRSNEYFGPRSGPANSISGYFSHRDDLKRWQQRMKDRGWDIAVDGFYGDGTERVAKAFQKQIGAKQDGLIGGTTWRAAWESPIT
jgi:GH25 family lysozyme M1 (1,4-beta-N-acetylmuramidase)